MNTQYLHIKKKSGKPDQEEETALRRAGEIIRSGGLVAFPTETVYGRIFQENICRKRQAFG